MIHEHKKQTVVPFTGLKSKALVETLMQVFKKALLSDRGARQQTIILRQTNVPLYC